MFRRLSILLLVAVIAVAGLGLTPHKEAKAQGTTIVIWHAWQDAELDLLNTWIENYTGMMSDVTFETRYVPFDDLRSTYESAAATGEGPDLLIGAADWAGPLATAGLVLPLSETVAGTDLEANLTTAAWDLMGYDGERYGIPVTLDGVALYFNRDLIDDADVPTDLMGLVMKGLELNNGDDKGLIFNNGFYQTAGIYFGLGGQLFDADGNNLWNTDDIATSYLKGHQDIFNALNATGQIGGDNALFREGKVALFIDGVWNLNTYVGDLGDSLGVALLPDVAEGQPWMPFFGGKGFYVNSTSDNVEASLAFLTYVTSADGLSLGSQIAGHVPPSDSVTVEDPNIAVFAQQFARGVALPTSPAMGAYWEPLGNAITAVTQGGEDPAAAAAAAEATILEKLAPPTEGTTTGDVPATVVDAATANPDLATFLQVASLSPDTVAALAGEGPFTIFAPSNDAFTAMMTSNPDLVAQATTDPSVLVGILTYHVVPGLLMASDVAASTELTTLNGAVITVTVDGDSVILNGTIKVTTTDIVAGNGVIHIIDGVLLPPQ
ncbi:MAG: extracellular solute-binding protein [Chloroflexi bacterium]|nr:extracellular solute-binding protein [Chloroflexota bacterium]